MGEYNIVSERNYQHWPSYHIVYEWEDIFAENGFNLILLNNNLFNKIWRRINRFIKKRRNVSFKSDGSEYFFRWIMDASRYKEYTDLNTIPIFLDFPYNMINEIEVATRDLPFYWVTSYDVYDALKQLGSKNVHFIPLSISDKYYTHQIPEKSCGVIQFGRKNPVLHEYMLRYCEKKPEVEYLFQTEDGSLTYISTIKGNLGKFDSRDAYFHLLSTCRISLVSSPGKDHSRDFGGIDFITPRFYESAANYCYMIGRYTKNIETQIIGIEKVCPCVESYEHFEKLMDFYIDETEFKAQKAFDEFLSDNVTSVRIQEILKIVKNPSLFN